MSNFRQIDRETGFLLPPSVDEWLPERHLARFIVEVIAGLYAELRMAATDKGLEYQEKKSGRSGMSLQDLIATNASAGLNRLAGFDVTAAENGAVEIVMEWNDDFTQYAGHLHAGMIAALLDTACGFAAINRVEEIHGDMSIVTRDLRLATRHRDDIPAALL